MANLDYVKGTKIHSFKHFVNFLFGDVVIKTVKDKKTWEFKLYVRPNTFNTNDRLKYKEAFENEFKGVRLIEVDD